MDKEFQKYLEHHLRWNRFSINFSAWGLTLFVPGWIYKYFIDYEKCVLNDPDFIEILAPKDLGYNGWIISSCARGFQHDLLAYAWIFLVLAFTLISVFKPEALGLKALKNNGDSLNKKTAALSVLLEWFPSIIGAVYILVFSTSVTISSSWTTYTAVGLAQLVWLAPVWFKINGRNIADTITGVEHEITAKEFEKLEAKFKRKLKIKGVGSTPYALLVIICSFIIVQTLRTPEQNSAYQQALYEGTDPIWEDNMYFAIQGLSAPEEVEDFYKYGEVYAHKRFRAFRAMKKRLGTREEYLFDVPNMEYGSIDTNPEKWIRINKAGWKKLSCIYDLREIKNDLCANLDDIPLYIEMNKTLWNRYNEIPNMGSIYKAIPQLLGAKLNNFTKLTDLKSAHIIYLAKNERSDEAMKEWLRFMALFRAIAEDRNSTVVKAAMAVQIQKFIKTLESLLYNAPNLAGKFKEELNDALHVNDNIFNEQYMMGVDWGEVEPYSIGSIGNLNALQNEYLVCIEALRSLARTSAEEYPYASEHMKLCPLDSPNASSHKYLIKSALTPGTFRANVIYVLLMSGALKGQTLIEVMKILQVRFLQAELAIKILAEGQTSSEIDRYISETGSEYHNPIEGAPFKWNPKEQALSFQRPDGKRPFYFKINL